MKEPARPLTVGEWCDEYERIIRALPLKQITISNRINYIRHIRLSLSSKQLTDVEPLDLILILRGLENAGKPYMRRRVRIEAIQLFNEGIIARKTNFNPAAAISFWKTRPARSRLTLEHWQAIHAWARATNMAWFALALELALVSSQRRADIVRLGHTDVVGHYLRVCQQKTGRRIALPLDLYLEKADLRLGSVLERMAKCGAPGLTLLRRKDGKGYCPGHLSNTFKEGLRTCFPGKDWGEKRKPPSFHEIRSLSERLYRQQGVDTMTLLGHSRQSMTDEYNDDRGLEEWKVLKI